VCPDIEDLIFRVQQILYRWKDSLPEKHCSWQGQGRMGNLSASGFANAANTQLKATAVCSFTNKKAYITKLQEICLHNEYKECHRTQCSGNLKARKLCLDSVTALSTANVGIRYIYSTWIKIQVALFTSKYRGWQNWIQFSNGVYLASETGRTAICKR
jgi:hypothetical protein